MSIKMSTIASTILKDLKSCDKDCYDCRAYIHSVNDFEERNICLAVLIQEHDKHLKAEIEKLLEKY